MFISFVLPAYDEEKNVKQLTERIILAMEKLDIPFEIIYTIDGTDNTYPILKEMQNNGIKNMKLFHNKIKSGYANALKQGFNAISEKTTHVLTMDCDLNHAPEELYRFIEEAKKGSDFIIGSRELKDSKIIGMPKSKRFVSLIANTVFKFITDLKAKDKTSGYRLIKRRVIEEIAFKIKSKNFEYLMEFLLTTHKKQFTISEVPITFTYRIYGQSKFELFKTAYGYIKILWRLS